MNEMVRKAIAYATNFLSFLMLEKDGEKIRNVYVFGSAMRNELNKESDIDLFIDCKKEDEDRIAKVIKLAERRFRLSKDFEKWRILNFTYPISIKTGPIDEWELKKSIESEGILLFSNTFSIKSNKGNGKFQTDLEKEVIFIIELPKDKRLYLLLTRALFGRKEKGFNQRGVVEKQNGIRLGSDVFIVPKSSQHDMILLLHRHKINFKMKEILAV
ncbi:MAG: nucleotidyltransferase domain-containing protein [Candidatus Aenigmatarchaeota archaeon]